MAYKKGELAVVVHGEGTTLPGTEDETSESRCPSDARQGYKTLRHGAYLPHSCDSWVIGGPEEIEALISDLKLAADLLRGRAI
jgi:hypothetical protein